MIKFLKAQFKREVVELENLDKASTLNGTHEKVD